MAPVFSILGEHKVLPSCSVLPINFVPRFDEDATAVNPDAIGQGSSPLPDAEEVLLLRQSGSGAYSRVYRVRIDPDHHKLSEVTKCP